MGDGELQLPPTWSDEFLPCCDPRTNLLGPFGMSTSGKASYLRLALTMAAKRDARSSVLSESAHAQAAS